MRPRLPGQLVGPTVALALALVFCSTPQAPQDPTPPPKMQAPMAQAPMAQASTVASP